MAIMEATARANRALNPTLSAAPPWPPFVPHPLVRGGQLQTAVGQLLGKPPVLTNTERALVPLADGDQLLLQIERPGQATREKSPLVLLMHGLGGSANSSYIVRQSAKLNSLGFTALRFNHRGCGEDAAHLAKQIYHSGSTGDLAATLAYMEERWPGRPYVVAAFSLSGNLLLHFLAVEGRQKPWPGLQAALAVCPAIDLELCSLAVDHLRNWHIDRYYTAHIGPQALQREARRPEAERRTLPRRLTVRRFDEAYTAPLAGFASRAEYYARCSAKDHLGKILVPTEILAASDDPIVPAVSFAGLQLPPSVRLHLERTGGHMGFVSKDLTPFGDRRWMDLAVVRWVERWAAEAR